MQVTREIYWNVPDWAIALMYMLFAFAIGVFAYGVGSRVRLWRQGAASPSQLSWRRRARQLLTHAIQQVVIWRSPAAGLSHFAMFWSFIVLLIGTCIVAIEDYGTKIFGVKPLIFHGWFYLSVSFVLQVSGILFILGLCMVLFRSHLDRTYRPLRQPIDLVIIWTLLVIGITGFLLEGLRIAGAGGGMAVNSFEKWSFLGWLLGALFATMSEYSLRAGHLSLWLLHMGLTMFFIAALPYCKLRHILFSPLNIALANPRQSGTYVGVSMEEVEETGRYGAARITDFSWRQLLSFDACTLCARCQTVCPAHATGKPLSPMRVVRNIASSRMGSGGSTGRPSLRMLSGRAQAVAPA